MVLLGIVAALKDNGYELPELGQRVPSIMYVRLRLVSVSMSAVDTVNINIPSHPSSA